MKKIFRFLFLIPIAALLTGCLGDNYEQPNAAVYGEVRDAETGDLILQDIGGEMLVISQFTLLAVCRKGRRPSFIKAGKPDHAKKMHEEFAEDCRKIIPRVETGEFGAYMQVSLVNDGPFTIVLDSNELS